ARQNDMEIFAEVRVNDTHDAVGTWEEPHSMMAQFKLDNPDYLVARNQSVYDIVCGKWTAYDFGQPAVREKFLAIVKDLIDNYAGVGGLDGIHFDLYRHGMFFRSVAEGGKASQEEIDAFTQIFADIHQYAEQKGKERGFPILISMRTPDSLGHCKDIGMDLEEWMRRGYVDLLMTTGYAKLESWQTMSDLCHGYGIKYYATDDTAGDSPMYNNGLPAEFKRRSQEAHFGRIASAFQEGADGIHYFNSYFQSAYVNFMRSDYASMAGATKRYYITQFTQIPAERLSISARKHQKNLPQLWCEEPALISPGKTNNYILESGDSAALIAEQGGQVEFLGILYGEISAPQNLQITTQGQEWTYLLSNGRVHYFKIPDTAILAGENEVSISISGEPCSDLDWKTLIQGDRKPSSGPKDGNFRRITNGGAEDLVDTDNDGTPDALAFIDDGTGGPGIFCALPIPGAGTYAGDDFDVNMRFDVQVVSASDDRAVVLRVGDGQHTEVISFTTDKISLLSSGVSVDYTTTEMKSYELQMTDSELILRSGNAESGYSEILRGTLEWTVDDSRAGFKGVDTHVNNLYGCGFYIGSMSNEGTGTAYWKNVAVGQPAGSEIIHDFCVESRSTPPLNPHPMKMCYDIFANYDPWHGGPIGGTPATYFQGYKSQKDSNDKWPLFLTTGNRRWQSTGVVVEVDINVTKGKVVLAASNGGEVIFQVIGPQYTIFPGDSGDLDQGPIALWTGAEPHTRRIDFHSNGKMNYFAFKLDEAGVPQASMNGVARNVTRFLNSSQAAFFTGDPNSGEQRILRWSGVLVKPMSDDAEFEMGQIRIAYDTKIADDNLRAALNEVLSEAPDLPENVVISPDSLITNCDLRYRIGDHPQKLDLSGRGICDLTGMDFALGLIELNLSHNNLSSPYPIRNISVLRKLDLSYNPLLSNTELQYITKRTTDLNLSGNPLLTDFSALGLATKTYLVNLTIDNGAVADISSLAAARDAATLLVRNQVVTIKPEESTFDNPIKGLDGSPVPLDSEWLEEVPGEVGKLRLKEGHPDNFGAGWSLSLKNAGGGDRGTFSGTLIVDTSEPLTVSVEKLWDDADNQDGLRPESIDISLFRAVGAADPALVETKSVTPDADGKWLASFTSLSKYEGMEEIVYTVDEAEVPTGYTKAITGTVAEGVTITNAHTPATVD
ncbi:MAG: Cna B-type domain-containing protein, partial [Clostridiaceae bacterium]|nr:Cna B-type domain-containing protein [Clostridiaceae bacterium]